jgi:branched-chain amino acid transport system substrate-binding protein
MKRVVSLVVVAMLLVVLGSCQNRQDVVRIGAILPLTGGAAPYAVSMKRGIDLAVEEVNASGGISGRRLEIVYEDSKGDAKTGVSAFNKLATMDKVPLVLGSLTGVILAIQPEADRNSVVLINTSAISPLINEKADNFLFNLVVNGETEAIAMAKKFHSKYPDEKIAVLYANNPSGVHVKDVFTRNLSQLGNSNYITESYELDATDFRIQLDRIKKGGARFGYLLAFSNKEFADILRQAKELNLDIQWFSVSGIESRETIELAGEATNGVIYSYPKIIDDTMYSNFQTNYTSKYDTVADIYTVNFYDAVNLISAVMKGYGTTALDIQRGLRSIDSYYGIFGNFKLSNTGKQFVNRELLWKTIKNGEFEILE